MIRLASPDIRETDIQRVIEVLKSGNLIQGQYVIAFEQALTSFTGVSNCAVVSSCTAALHLSLIALGIRPGDTVIVPAFTFPATANVVENLGANVLLCDVDRRSYVVTPEAIENCIKNNHDKNLKAIIIVHEFGYPASIKEISRIAKQYELKLIEDAACALGTVADGYQPGYYSDAACYSFHPRKALTTGEGGAVLSNSLDFINKIRFLRNHGILTINGQMDFIAAGLNYRMTDFQAALAIGQMERFGEELKKRQELIKYYVDFLKDEKRLTLPGSAEGHSWQSFMVILDETINRGHLIKQLLDNDIQTNLGAQALNCLTYYRKKYHLGDFSCPNASKLYKQGLVLPLYGKLDKEDITIVCSKLKELL